MNNKYDKLVLEFLGLDDENSIVNYSIAEILEALEKKDYLAQITPTGQEFCVSFYRKSNPTKGFKEFLILPSEREAILKLILSLSLSCCDDENRSMAGGCENCGDPSF